MNVGTRSAAAMATVFLCGAGAASASAETVMKATVPFAFEVNGHTMPAGTYLIQRDDMTSPSVLVIRRTGRGNHDTAMVTTLPDSGQDPAGTQPALAFKRHEREYQLTSVWPSSGEGFDVNSR
jgi:hypothetical protein